MSITERYIDMNEELDATKPLKKDLNTYDICLIKEFMHLITRELELLYINLDSRFKDVKASIKVELRNYSKFRKIESVSDDFANYIHRIFGIILDLYKIAHTNKSARRVIHEKGILYNVGPLRHTVL